MTRWRLYVGFVLLLASEFALFGAAEGYHKWDWIVVGSAPNLALFAGFVLL